ncbi:MAG: hypothetical protein Q8Q97_02470 [bacterium]|nr:hypothetical protein [bacterium]
MEQENQNKKDYSIQLSIIAAALLISGAWIYTSEVKITAPGEKQESQESIEVVLPVRWGDLGAKMASVGAIDAKKLEALYASRDGLNEEEKKLLYDSDNGLLKITPKNSGFILNLFWALGLGNKNEILENGPMSDQRYGGAGGFASTGGWTLAKGGAMDHYSRHKFFNLTPEQQKLVERVSKNIYRPCCDNPTHFPDCNHGMAMLGLLELMASQGISEEEMYKTALQVNALWFPEEYQTIAKYLETRGTAWGEADPKEILGANYSSASGFRRISALVPKTESQGGSGGCGVDSGQSAVPQRQQSGCGI